LPGVSRSGSTIFALSLGENKTPKDILKLSYLMSAPVVLASSLFLIFKGDFVLSWGVLGAILFAFIVGFLSLKVLLKLVEKINFFWFALFFALLCFLAGLGEFIL